MSTLRNPPGERTPLERLDFGLVNLDKPAGPSAHQVAAWARDIADVDRVAHGGTLDPTVTGCLPLLLGDASRCARVFLEAPKEYVAVLETHAPIDAERLDATIADFEGEIYQRPPKRSAVRRELRSRTVHGIAVHERTDRRALLRISCESGTYVRKLCHDIGLALGTGGHMAALRRTAAGPLDDRSVHTLHDLTDGVAFAREDGDPDLLDSIVRPAEEALDHLPRVVIARNAGREVANGAPVYAPGVMATDRGDGEPLDGAADEGALVVCYTPEGAAVCLGRLVGDPEAERGTVVDLDRVLV